MGSSDGGSGPGGGGEGKRQMHSIVGVDPRRPIGVSVALLKGTYVPFPQGKDILVAVTAPLDTGAAILADLFIWALSGRRIKL